MDKSVRIKTALGVKGSLMVCCFPPISPHYTDMPQWTLRIFSQIMLPSGYCQFWKLLLSLGMGEGIGGLGRPYMKFELCPFAIYSCVMEKGVCVLYLIFTNFAQIY